jgi:hypothetical protein
MRKPVHITMANSKPSFTLFVAGLGCGGAIIWSSAVKRGRAFIYVPPFVPHQEINALPDQPCEAVVVRSGQEPIVVNLDIETAENAGTGALEFPFHPRHGGIQPQK